VHTEEVVLNAHQTKPPARYSEASLLTAMEGAGKAMDDEELRAAMAGRGLGTPATRAQIIENLLAEQYLLREGRELAADRQGLFADDSAQRTGHPGADGTRTHR
jgi:DNA topoisomerase-3